MSVGKPDGLELGLRGLKGYWNSTHSLRWNIAKGLYTRLGKSKINPPLSRRAQVRLCLEHQSWKKNLPCKFLTTKKPASGKLRFQSYNNLEFWENSTLILKGFQVHHALQIPVSSKFKSSMKDRTPASIETCLVRSPQIHTQKIGATGKSPKSQGTKTPQLGIEFLEGSTFLVE